MNKNLLGPWVRRFLLEHLVNERNLARNTQKSYRDALCLLLPFVARMPENGSTNSKSKTYRPSEFVLFCTSLEKAASAEQRRATKGWPRFIPCVTSSRCATRNVFNGAERSEMSH